LEKGRVAYQAAWDMAHEERGTPHPVQISLSDWRRWRLDRREGEKGRGEGE